MKIIGVDEANYSPSLAGDCIVVAYLKTLKRIRGVKDSKQLAHKKRLELLPKLQAHGLYSIALASINDIEHLGIYKARNLAIIEALKTIKTKLFWLGFSNEDKVEIIIDGCFSNFWIDTFYSACDLPVSCLIKGDEKVYEISAASIIARTYADCLFEGFGKFYPGYDLENCHGSPSKKMYEKIRAQGPSPYHRIGSYAPGWWEKIQSKKPISAKDERGKINEKQ